MLVECHDVAVSAQKVCKSSNRGRVEALCQRVRVVVEQPRINIEGHGRGCVSEQALDRFHVRASTGAEARRGRGYHHPREQVEMRRAAYGWVDGHAPRVAPELDDE